MSKKLKKSILSLAMVAVLLIGNIMAYFTDGDTATNVFTVGSISIDLQEPSWDPTLGEEIFPGYEMPKDPQILNDGLNDAYVFITVDVPYKNVIMADEEGNKFGPVDAELFSYNVNNEWTQVGEPTIIEDNETMQHVYAYAQEDELTVLEPGETTQAVFDFIRFENISEDNGLEELDLDVVIEAYGIQTQNISDGKVNLDGDNNDGKVSPEEVWPIVKNARPTAVNEMENEMQTIAMDDTIVLDYGLPVKIDPLANDIFSGDSVEIVYIGGPNVEVQTTKNENILESVEIIEDGVAVVSANGALTNEDYAINNHECHSGEIVFEDVEYNALNTKTITMDTLTYVMNKQLTEVEEISYVIEVKGTDYEYAVGKIYIVPATVMYYEENFNSLVKFANSANAKWDATTTITDAESVSEYQEPGVVGTVGDSPYGSDVAYLNDSGDSNGTSRFGDTTNGPLRFGYTFTGTGTSFFARTSAETGYLQIKLYEGTTNTGNGYIKMWYRDTYYRDENGSDGDSDGTLYNVPVFTESGLEYGTYTVVVTVAQKGAKTTGNPNGAGPEFYVDGVRIMQPLNKAANEELTGRALAAYSADGELNMNVVTLREKLLTEVENGLTAWNFIVFTDTHGEVVTAEDYEGIGPKEELYLDEGQSISFGVRYNKLNEYKLHLGMKAPIGTANIKCGTSTMILENAVDCYYDITNNYTSTITKYEQAKDDAGHLLFIDEMGNEVYRDSVEINGTSQMVYRYVHDDTDVLDVEKLTPKDDLTQPYKVAVYTIKSLNGIVSLTNLKASGDYEFVLY